MKKPLVTIYIPTKNRINLLARALASVIEQTYSRIEIIIVNDGGETVKTKEILTIIDKAHKIQIIELTESVGAPNARNIAIKAANGYFITGLDDDDYFLDDRVQKFVSNWNEKYAFISARSIANTKDKLNFFKDILIREKRVFTADSFFDENVVGNQIFTLTSRLNKQSFDSKLPALQDFELWFRLAKSYGPFLSLKNRTQIIDTEHGHTRITNLPRRESALKMVCKKHDLKKNRFRCLLLFWKVEFNKPLTMFDALYLLKKRRIKLVLLSLSKQIKLRLL